MAKQIVNYFLRNPRAADSLEGIARWRLLDEQVHQSVRMTETALSYLVGKGLLLAERTETAGRLYHLNESRRSEAEQFVRGKSSSAPRGESRGKRRGCE